MWAGLKGEQAFEALIREYPDNVWGYIGWGDMYHFSFYRTDSSTDLASNHPENLEADQCIDPCNNIIHHNTKAAMDMLVKP